MSVSAHKTDRSSAPQKSGRRWLWLAIYLPVWGFCVAWYWLGMGGGGWIMAYGILALRILLPLATLAAAVAVGWQREWGLWRWGALVLLPALYGLHILVTTSLSTALGITKIAPMGFAVMVCPLIFTFLGLLMGMGARALRDKARDRRPSGR
ncbi:hypothetical protein [uncultured Gemmiger sp.]|uniref:hypothetical protein n=1 Tax=uncultured Gemmiger sp. TaxID=1623490 RepID=UPI0025F05569|nr:hypothetical protein [uncultured Gemmiger sp.]